MQEGAKVDSELKNLTVLYVEDDEDILESLKRPLTRRVKELFTATNGQEGIEAYKKVNPDIVITDIRMPVMDGLKMARAIKAINEKIPIIITSAFDDTDYFVEAIDIGVSQYVLKPIDINKLLKALEHSVETIILEHSLAEKSSALRANLKILTEYKNAIDSSAIVSKSNKDGVFTDVNDQFCEATGYAKEELVGKHYSILYADENIKDRDLVAQAYEQNSVFKGIVKNRKKDGTLFYANLTAVPILDQNGELIELIGVRQDITKLINQIYTDPLTNYPNRAALIRDIDQADDPLIAVINIDRFKEINDFYGTKIGDELLKAVVKMVDSTVSKLGVKTYKLSADEFGILVANREILQDEGMFLRSIHRDLEEAIFVFDDHDIGISVSIGAVCTKDEPLAKADMALKVAKKERKAVVTFTDLGDIKKDYEHNFRWINKIKDAIRDDRIAPWFQPIVDSSSKEIVKYECLMRMFEDDGSVIAPNEFLPIAYKTRLYTPLTKIMIAKACKYFREIPTDFSFNMTISDVLNREIVQFLRDNLEANGVTKQLVIELLESEGIEKYPEVEQFIKEFKALGCKIAIDDFGSGYSNFEHLLKLNVDIIKIDGSIIRQVDSDRNSRVIAETISDFAKKLGIKTVAEFVHSKEVLEVVKEVGIDYSQGFFLGKPSSKAEIV